jgi:penicillin amidase
LKEAKEAAKRATEEVIHDLEDQIIYPEKLDENMASNNWVIHGNYTKTGKPLLAGDPHLGN